MALLFAKEQYARRFGCVNLWVVRSADVFASEYEDDDMFLPAHDKSYREASAYRNREKIEDFLAGADKIVSGNTNYGALAAAFDNPNEALKASHTAASSVDRSTPVAPSPMPDTAGKTVLQEKRSLLVGPNTAPREIKAKILQ
jgi:hypothetical protein